MVERLGGTCRLPVSPTSTTTCFAVGAGRHPQRAVAGHRVDGVVDQVRPDLVELAGDRLDARHVGAVVAHHRHAVADPVRQHHERALQPLGDVGELHRGPVELGVGLHRRHQLGDATGRLLHLAQQAACRVGAGDPLEPGPQPVAVEHLGDPLAPRDVDACGRERGRDQPVPVDAAPDEPGRQRVLPVGHHHRVRGPGRLLDLATQRVEGDELGCRDRALGEPPEGREQRLAGIAQRVHRARRGRGRVVDLVGEPGRQRAEGDQRLLLPRHRLDVAGGEEQALDQVRPEREPVARPGTQRGRRDAQHPAGHRRPAGRQVDAVVVPGAEPARPPARCVHGAEHRLAPPRRAAPGRCCPPAAPTSSRPARPRRTAPRRAGTRTSVPQREQLRQLLVAEPGEQLERAQLVEGHHIVAR